MEAVSIADHNKEKDVLWMRIHPSIGGHFSNFVLDTENLSLINGAFYFPTAGAMPEAFMLHFLNTSKTVWGHSQGRQTAG
jgi:hypothetical protein